MAVVKQSIRHRRAEVLGARRMVKSYVERIVCAGDRAEGGKRRSETRRLELGIRN